MNSIGVLVWDERGHNPIHYQDLNNRQSWVACRDAVNLRDYA